MLVDSLAVEGIEFVAAIQTNEGVRLAAQGMLDALEPVLVQGDQVRNCLVQGPFFGAALYRFVPAGFIQAGKKTEAPLFIRLSPALALLLAYGYLIGQTCIVPMSLVPRTASRLSHRIWR